MDKTSFPFPKINRPKKTSDKKADEKLSETFDFLEEYLNKVSPYIFTDIRLDYDQDDDRFLLSRVQQNLSNVLLRSLYIRNGIVDSINSRNTVSLFSNLKSFIEVPAMLAQLFSIINNISNKEDAIDALATMALGNKGEGTLRVGSLDITNILSMFKKLDTFINNLRKEKTDSNNNSIMSDFYGLVCNSSHPNYDAHDITATFNPNKGIWRGLSAEEVRSNFVLEYDRYAPPLIVTIVMIEALSERIFKSSNINRFNKLDNNLYFEER